MKELNKVNVNNEKLNMNLQLLADDEGQETSQGMEEGAAEQQTSYTQEELNKLVEERAKEMASKHIVKEKNKLKKEFESLKSERELLESEKLAKMNESEKMDYQLKELQKEIKKIQQEKEEERSRYDYERLTNQTKDMLVEKGLPGALANMVMAGAEGEAEAIQQNIVALQEYVNQAIDAGVEARIKASSGAPKTIRTSKGITLDEIKNMSPAEINARWEEIKKSIKN